jgi:hypothetical protein
MDETTPAAEARPDTKPVAAPLAGAPTRPARRKADIRADEGSRPAGTKATGRGSRPAAKGGRAAKAPGKEGPPMERVPGESVRALMAELDITAKELAAAGGFSLSRVAELRHVGDLPPSWGGRDRRATTRQWAQVEKKARQYAGKR